jgi:hypothetical protein
MYIRSLSAMSAVLLATLLAATSARAQKAQSKASGKSAPVEQAGTISIEQPIEWNDAPGSRGIVMSINRSVHVSGVADSPLGITDVRINGLQPVLEHGATPTSLRFSGYISIDANTRKAEIVATTTSGVKFTKTYPVTPLPRDTTLTPQQNYDSAAAGFKGKRYALIIGISKYRDPQVPQLKYAAADAKAFYDFLRSERAGLGGVPRENIKILLNEQATYEAMRKALRDWLKVPTEDDVVYLYFAGHGGQDPDRRSDFYLLPYNADADNIASTGYPMDELNKDVKRISARQVVLLTDACHSGAITGDQNTRSAFSLNDINRVFAEQLEQSHGGSVVFTASEGSQLSQEGEQWGGGHGVFTYHVIEALKGYADDNRDGIVSLGEMLEYTRTHVLRDTRNAQAPFIQGTTFDRNWPMAIVLPGEAVIPEISEEDIKAADKVSDVISSAYDFPWKSTQDSLISVVGMSDTVQVQLQNDARDIIPGQFLNWSTSNPAVLQVDSFGVIRPVGPGLAAVTARGLGRKISVPVKVYDRPRQFVFTPADTLIDLVSTERFEVHADLLVGTGLWLKGIIPKMSMPDTLLLSRDADGGYVALREGETRLTGQVAGTVRSWRVRIRAPLVRINKLTKILLIGDSMPLGAERTRRNGTPLGEAPDARWESTDTSVLKIRDNTVVGGRIGSAKVIAVLGPSSDTMSLSVMGDLLVATNQKGGPTLNTVAIATGEVFRLGADSIKPADAALSPDGQTIVFTSAKDERLYLMQSDGQNVRRLSPEYSGIVMRAGSYKESNPRWTYDGKRIVFVSNRPGNYEIFSMTSAGTDVQRITNDGDPDWHVSASPQVGRIAFERIVGAGNSDIFISLPDGTQQTGINTDVQDGIQQSKVSETRPAFVGASNMLIIARGAAGLDERAGQALTLYNVADKIVVKELARPVRDHDVRFAVSPDGKRVAYHMRATWGKKDSSITIIDINGDVLKTLNLGRDVEINEITWGAIPLKTEKKQ